MDKTTNDMMDNRIFNVNGTGQEMLRQALNLAFIQSGYEDDPSTCKGWVFSEKHGLILLWATKPTGGQNEFPCDMTANQITPLVVSWLNTAGKTFKPINSWDKPHEGDGSNELGWRVYCEDWGHVGLESYAICAVVPVCLWLGK